jgi:ABC-2 type transport system permease protein
MFDEKALWKERFGKRLRDLGRYLRYIFNGHLVVVLLFLLGSAGYYYQNWIATLSGGFPVEIIMAVLLGIFLTYSPVYNFLLEADQVFLIPLETRLKGYFLRSGGASFIFQGYILLMVFAVLMPMYAHGSGKGFRLFLPFFVLLLAAKAWNLAVSWKMDYQIETRIHLADLFVRYVLNVVFFYLLFQGAKLIFLVVLGFIMGFYYYSFASRANKMGLKWDRLIAQEEKRMASFYRLANLFTDVPKVKDTVKRRKWLDFLLGNMAFSQEKTYLYLYSRTFLRSGDYLGLFVRLTVIGSLGIYFLSFGWGKLLLAVLFLYLTGFQLMPLWNHHQNKLWVDLYPAASKYKWVSFRMIMLVILTVQTVIFVLLILLNGEWMIGLISLIAGLAFTYIFVTFYSKNRLKPAMDR